MSTDDDRLTVAEVAEHLGIAPSTFRSYVARDQAPKPDGHHDARTPWWRRATIERWHDNRRGAGGRE